MISNVKGEQKIVLIELQKDSGQADLHRFRDYLSHEYLPKKTKLKNPKNCEVRQYIDLKVYDESKELMPLICVYILGFPLKDKSLIVKRKGQYRVIETITPLSRSRNSDKAPRLLQTLGPPHLGLWIWARP